MAIEAERPATQAPGAPVEVVGKWYDSHSGTRRVEVRDPDGRVHFLEHHPHTPESRSAARLVPAGSGAPARPQASRA